MTKQYIEDVRMCEYQNEETTVSVTVTDVNNHTETFHVQMHDLRHRRDLGCWGFTDDAFDDIDYENYPTFNIYEIIEAAEQHVQN